MLKTILRSALLLAIVAGAAAQAQVRLPSVPTEVPKLGRLPSLNDLLGRDPLTSSLNDAVTEVAFLDRFDPKTAAPLLELPLGLDDGVTMVPGLWEADLQGYCLQPGTNRPRSGDGYLWAPLKGPKAGVVTTILNRSAQYRDIPQQDIQVLPLVPDVEAGSPITAEEITAERQRVEQGWTADERKAAAVAGLSDAELETVRQAILTLTPPDSPITSEEALRELIDAIRALGERWSSLPGIPAPWVASGSQARLVASR